MSMQKKKGTRFETRIAREIADVTGTLGTRRQETLLSRLSALLNSPRPRSPPALPLFRESCQSHSTGSLDR